MSEELSTLAEAINAEHRAFVEGFKMTVEHGIRAGGLLVEARERCPHGTWLAWLDDNFEGSRRTAQVYMRLYHHRDEIRSKSAEPAHLTLSGALNSIAAPGRGEETTGRQEELLPEIRRGCFDMAEKLIAAHRGRAYWELGYEGFVPYVKGEHPGSWLAHAAEDLVDGRGEPYDTFMMAGVLYHKLHEAIWNVGAGEEQART